MSKEPTEEIQHLIAVANLHNNSIHTIQIEVIKLVQIGIKHATLWDTSRSKQMKQEYFNLADLRVYWEKEYLWLLDRGNYICHKYLFLRGESIDDLSEEMRSEILHTTKNHDFKKQNIGLMDTECDRELAVLCKQFTQLIELGDYLIDEWTNLRKNFYNLNAN